MNYEQKYKEDLEAAKGWLAISKKDNNTTATQILESLFPELRESEDEKIRKSILELVKQSSHILNPMNQKSMIAWLEKQGNQEPADKVEPKFKVGDWITNSEYTWKITDIKPLDYILQSQNGDIVDDNISYVGENFRLWTIQDANDGDVLATKKGNPFIYDKDRYNNGLAYYYAGLDVNKELTLKSPHHMLAHFGELCSIFPATKEQRDLLFQKMKEAGYEWNAEKKELKKIKQEPTWNEKIKGLNELETYILSLVPDRSLDAIKVDAKNIRYIINKEQKSAVWSEEDSKNLNSVKWIIENSENLNRVFETIDSPEYIKKYFIDWLNSLKDRVQSQPKQEWSEKDAKILQDVIHSIKISRSSCEEDDDIKDRYDEELDWLKSLKPNHWKPSEEQMQALNWIAYNYTLMDKGREEKLQSLYNGLKTL